MKNELESIEISKLFVFKFIWRHNKLIIFGTLLAVIVALSYIITLDTPELFVGAEKWYNFAYNISLSIIAAFIFYSFQIIIPNLKKDILRESNRNELVKDFFEYLDIFFRDIAVRTKYCEPEELESDEFEDDYPCGYDELFSYMCDKYDDHIISSFCAMMSEISDHELLVQMIDYIKDIQNNYFDLTDYKRVVLYLKMKEVLELLLIILTPSDTNTQNISNIRHIMITSIKRMYLLSRTLQRLEGVEPQYKFPHFKPRNFAFK